MNKIFPRIDVSPFFCVAVVLASTYSLSQKVSSNTDTAAAAQMRFLNNSLLHLHGQMAQADTSIARTLRGQAAGVITERASALTKLIQNDPHAALTFAFSPELLKDLANKFPQSSARLESHTTVTGQ